MHISTLGPKFVLVGSGAFLVKHKLAIRIFFHEAQNAPDCPLDGLWAHGGHLQLQHRPANANFSTEVLSK